MGVPDRRALSHGRNIRVSACASQGGRKYMEDRIHVHCARLPNGELDYVFLGVYDGHGGAEAPSFARQHLHDNIVSQRAFHSDNDDDVLQAIQEGFLTTHHAMTKVVDQWARTASGFTSTSGTTASIAFIRRGKLYTGHVGDSGIVLGMRKDGGVIEAKQLTVDHKPDSPEELRRIEESGGEVMSKAGVMRVVWTRPIRGHSGPVRRSTMQEKIPFLAVARALGDLWSYNSNADNYVVSPDPDVGVVELTEESCCIVLGSDGLWNVIRAQYSTDIVNAHEWKMTEEQGSRPLEGTLSNHSRWLVRHGLRAWGCLRADNISAITVIIDPPSAQLPADSAAILKSSPNLDVDAALTEFPGSMIRITEKHTQLLSTEPVELIYGGALDPPLSLLVQQGAVVGAEFSGPGFTSYSFENAAQRRNSLVQKRISLPTGGQSISTIPAKKPRLDSGKTNGSAMPNGNHKVEDDAAEDPDEEPQKRTLSGKKPKYVCRKHGLTCAKVKSLNAKARQEVDKPAAASTSKEHEITNGEGVEKSLSSPGRSHHHHHSSPPLGRSAIVFHNTRQQSRVTRSGLHLESPPKGPLKRKSISAVLHARTSAAAKVIRSRSADSHDLDPEDKLFKASELTNGFGARFRSRGGQGTAHKRPRSALSIRRPKPPHSAVSTRFGSFSPPASPNGAVKDSVFVRSNISPRFLNRSPIHPLPPITSDCLAEELAEEQRAWKRKLFSHQNGTGGEKTAGEEPPLKKNRIWTSIMSMFGATPGGIPPTSH